MPASIMSVHFYGGIGVLGFQVTDGRKIRQFEGLMSV